MKNITRQTKKNEDEKISKVIHRVLEQVFGTEATHLIFKYLQKEYSLKRNEISENIDVFAKGLEEFLKSGAYVIERKILEDMYTSYGIIRKLEMEQVQKEPDFVGQMKMLMRRA